MSSLLEVDFWKLAKIQPLPLLFLFVCLFVCFVFDAMNKAAMCGKSLCYVMSQSFSSLLLLKNQPTWLRAEELKLEAKQNKTKKNVA